MKRILIIAIIIISYFETYSQIYEKGYFIDNSNQKVECLIKNNEWVNNPTMFNYKLSEDDTPKEATVQTVKEFGIYNFSKYIRAKTNIDKSSDLIDYLSSDKKPDFHQELLFLKVLIEGEATLYLHNDSSPRFFYKVNDSEIKQLVYKKYLANGYIHKNNHFKQQLFNLLKCRKLKLSDFEHLEYNKKDLMRLFIKYNKCKNSNFINYNTKQKKSKFLLTFSPGLNFSSFSPATLSTFYEKQNFWNPVKSQFRLQGEYIFPYYNNYKWSLIIEPTLLSYKYSFSKPIEQEIENNSGIIVMFPYNIKEIYVSKINYSAFQLSLGIRRYFYNNNNSKFFTNAYFIMNRPYNSTMEITLRDFFNHYSYPKTIISPSNNFALGFGYKYKDLLNIEIRYHTKNYLGAYYQYVYYRTISITAGISLL